MRLASTISVVLGLALLLIAMPANAAIEFLVLHEVNQLEDQDYETLINYVDGEYEMMTEEGNHTLDLDDLLVGIIRIQAINTGSPLYLNEQKAFNDGSPPNGFSGVFVLEVTGKVDNTGTTGFFEYDFGPAPDAAWTFLSLSRNDSDTMIKWYDDSTDPYIYPQADPTLANLQTALATADGTLLWEWGDTTDPDGNNNFFWRAKTTTDDVTAIDPGDEPGFQAGLNVTYDGVPGMPLDLHDEIAVLGFTTDGDTQVQLEGGFQGLAPANVFTVITDTNVYIVPTPEPGSVLIWGGLLGAMGLVAWRRRRKQV